MSPEGQPLGHSLAHGEYWDVINRTASWATMVHGPSPSSAGGDTSQITEMPHNTNSRDMAMCTLHQLPASPAPPASVPT